MEVIRWPKLRKDPGSDDEDSMSPALYSEDTLVQQTTVAYLEERLGWHSVYAYNHRDLRTGRDAGPQQ